MTRPIQLYVSSSPGLAPEREAVGRVVAALPVSTGWEIRHTPAPGEPTENALRFAASCDLYLILLGTDFAAPMGNSWRQAVHSERVTLAFYKQILRSPSAQWAFEQEYVGWRPFSSVAELEGLLSCRLAQALMDQGEHLGLHTEGVEGLLALLTEEEQKLHQPDRRSGAGRSGVILGRGHITSRE